MIKAILLICLVATFGFYPNQIFSQDTYWVESEDGARWLDFNWSHGAPGTGNWAEINASNTSNGQTILLNTSPSFSLLTLVDSPVAGRFIDDLEVTIQGITGNESMTLAGSLTVSGTVRANIRGVYGTSDVTLKDMTLNTPLISVSTVDASKSSPIARLTLDNVTANGRFKLTSFDLDAEKTTAFLTIEGGLLRNNTQTASSINGRTQLRTNNTTILSDISNSSVWIADGNTVYRGSLTGSGSVEMDNGFIIDTSMRSFGEYLHGSSSNDMSGHSPMAIIGGGSYTLSGNNSFSGELLVRDSQLNASAGFNLGQSSNDIKLENAVFNLTKSATLGNDFVLSTDSEIRIHSNAVFNGRLSGDGNLQFNSNDGFLTLRGFNGAFSGDFNVTGTTIRAENGQALGSGKLTLDANSRLILRANEDWGGIYGNGVVDIDLFQGRVFNADESILRGSLASLESGTLTMAGTGKITIQSNLSQFQGTLSASGGEMILGANAIGQMNGKTLKAVGGGILNLNTGNSDVVSTASIENFGTIVKTGSGTLTLTSSPTGSNGILEVRQGKIRTNHNHGSQLSFNGGEIEALDNLFGRIHVASSGGTLNLGSHFLLSGSTNFQGGISGSGTLIKSGTGSLIFAENSDSSGFTGTLDVQQGILSVNGHLQNGKVHLGDGTALDTYNNDTPIQIGSLTGTGTLQIYDLISLGIERKFRIGTNNTDSTFAGTIDGYGTVFKAGTGTWSITGNNVNSMLVIEKGTLAIGENGFGRGVRINNGTTLKLLDSFTSIDGFTLPGNRRCHRRHQWQRFHIQRPPGQFRVGQLHQNRCRHVTTTVFQQHRRQCHLKGRRLACRSRNR